MLFGRNQKGEQPLSPLANFLIFVLNQVHTRGGLLTGRLIEIVNPIQEPASDGGRQGLFHAKGQGLPAIEIERVIKGDEPNFHWQILLTRTFKQVCCLVFEG